GTCLPRQKTASRKSGRHQLIEKNTTFEHSGNKSRSTQRPQRPQRPQRKIIKDFSACSASYAFTRRIFSPTVKAYEQGLCDPAFPCGELRVHALGASDQRGVACAHVAAGGEHRAHRSTSGDSLTPVRHVADARGSVSREPRSRVTDRGVPPREHYRLADGARAALRSHEIELRQASGGARGRVRPEHRETVRPLYEF